MNMRPAEFERLRNTAPTAQPNPGARILTALSKARGEFPEIPRNRVATVRMKNGGQYSYNYADLADVFRAINPILSAYGLNVEQFPRGQELVTIIGHESGEVREYLWPIKSMPQRGTDDCQSFQSAVQVAKRYALTAALGISTEETVEGDEKATRRTQNNDAMKIDDNFDTVDGKRIPRGAQISKDMTPRQMAEEVARAIEAQLDDVKTPVGLNGVWNRNQAFIDKLSEKHSDLFDNVYDHFHSLMGQMDG